ncbi:putative P-loop containing nucleoside triphosphate hydrolase protein [Seiridium cardinale]|uniref:P-loop containing nucleoside triphosphate hydrolase protein n=1 Tax=Seiridium cardinale TaxID=138064 RepID=A0ABR2XDD8_9PEZI
MEPEALIPISVVPPSRECEGQYGPPPLIVMAGDEHQLGPRTAPPHTPLKTSLFARLPQRPAQCCQYFGRLSTPRSRNYRPHSAILAVPSYRFYFDTLEPAASPSGTARLAAWDAGGDATGRYCFMPTFLATSAGSTKAAGVMFMSIGLVEQDEVHTISPFKAQVRLLQQTIQLPKFNMRDVNIRPTNSFQGLEKGVVVLCTARSEAEFVANDVERGWGIIHRLSQTNIALTRAKFGLIRIGRRKVLHMDENWRAVLAAFCDRNGLVAGDDNDDEAADSDARTWTSAELDTNYDA